MKKTILVLFWALCWGIGTTAAGESRFSIELMNAGSGERTVVEIDYGPQRKPRRVEIPAVRGQTALAVLQSVATVKTRPVGPYVFVVAIDDVESRRGETAWYYEVDGKAPGESAYTKVLNGTKLIRWIYKQDVCSAKTEPRPDRSPERGDWSR